MAPRTGSSRRSTTDFAGRGRHGRDADVDRAALDVQREAAVLREAGLRDVEAAHDLQAADHRAQHVERRFRRVVQDAVDAHPDHDVARRGLDVEVGGAVGDGLLEQRVDELDDRCRRRRARRCPISRFDVVVVGRVVERALDADRSPSTRVRWRRGGGRCRRARRGSTGRSARGCRRARTRRSGSPSRRRSGRSTVRPAARSSAGATSSGIMPASSDVGRVASRDRRTGRRGGRPAPSRGRRSREPADDEGFADPPTGRVRFGERLFELRFADEAALDHQLPEPGTFGRGRRRSRLISRRAAFLGHRVDARIRVLRGAPPRSSPHSSIAVRRSVTCSPPAQGVSTPYGGAGAGRGFEGARVTSIRGPSLSLRRPCRPCPCRGACRARGGACWAEAGASWWWWLSSWWS